MSKSRSHNGNRPRLGIRSVAQLLVLLYFAAGPVYLVVSGVALFLCAGIFTLPATGCLSLRFETVMELMRQMNSGQILGLFLAVVNTGHGTWQLVLKRVPADQSRARYKD